MTPLQLLIHVLVPFSSSAFIATLLLVIVKGAGVLPDASWWQVFSLLWGVPAAITGFMVAVFIAVGLERRIKTWLK
ncbi:MULTISPECIES: hypothetical protein [unclassified Serratia (in: enterobacteria)]|uniref:hypothetical protein n=1 Tax=unclassified Serratia (in: enterobacteria) TaxID=2647522 RepID=UPI000501AE5C|nr:MULTISPECIES: hypothetical protein [unclassified Serratia (in: enterobacteria)]KFK93353.1 hypothetical protein JV45_16760 [Serratia sp. Ag2]KFK98354.1 hypothetical protein IV04_13235 [Serratia sp. Ag1]